MENQAITSEQAFDMLPYAVDIYDKLNFDKYRKELVKKYKGQKTIDYLDPVIDAAKFILKNSGKIKREVFNIVAIAENKKLEEVKQQSFFKTIQTFKKILSDPDLVSFFKEAMQ